MNPLLAGISNTFIKKVLCVKREWIQLHYIYKYSLKCNAVQASAGRTESSCATPEGHSMGSNTALCECCLSTSSVHRSWWAVPFFHRTHAGLGLALKRTVFAQCVITPYSSGNRTTEEPTNTIGGFLFFIRHYESSIPTGASGASQTTQCQSVAMLDQGQKTVMRKGTGNHWLRTLGNLYIIIFQRAHSNEQGWVSTV